MTFKKRPTRSDSRTTAPPPAAVPLPSDDEVDFSSTSDDDRDNAADSGVSTPPPASSSILVRALLSPLSPVPSQPASIPSLPESPSLRESVSLGNLSHLDPQQTPSSPLVSHSPSLPLVNHGTSGSSPRGLERSLATTSTPIPTTIETVDSTRLTPTTREGSPEPRQQSPESTIQQSDSIPSLVSASSSSDGEAFVISYNAQTTTRLVTDMTPRIATCTVSPGHSKPPVISAGSFTPELVYDIEMAALAHFDEKGVPADKQVQKIANSFQGIVQRTYWNNNRARLSALSFSDYMDDFCARFLEKNWAAKLDSTLRSYHQNGSDFRTWANDFQGKALLLEKTSFAHTDAMILRNLKSLCDDHLRARADRTEIVGLTELNEWIDAVAAEEHSLKEEAKYFANPNKRFKGNDGRARPANSGGGGGGSGPATSASSASTSGAARLPALTDAERQLLAANEGCYKCRQPFVAHRSTNCRVGFPKAENYVTLTQAIVDSLNPNKKNKAKPATVAAATTSYHNHNFDDDTRSIADSIAEDSSDGYSEVSALFSLPTWNWKCVALGRDNHPLPASSLLDGGSSLVLVSERFATQLGKPRRRLKTPFSISTAIPALPDSDSFLENKTVFRYYINLLLVSCDRLWTAKLVPAVIVPRLVDDMDMILGLPWLKTNEIVLDFEAETAVHKSSGYDLRQPSKFKPLSSFKLKKLTRADLKKVKHDQRALMRELKATLFARRIVFEDVLDGNGFRQKVLHHNVAAIQATIDSVNEKLAMEALDKRIREDYKDVFGTVPHVSELPDHEPCRVRLRDPDVVLDARNYSSPRKYKQAWNILINEHVAAGRIRASSSRHTSPSFLVPKSDPQALPRWVIDFRKLNANVIPDAFPLPRIDDILMDLGKGRFWCKFDMTNAFFQTRVHPDDAHLFATMTPMGAYDWDVMPMGYRNAPATQQRRMTDALREHIGNFCHVFVDDAGGWAKTLTELEKNIRCILDTCRQKGLYLNGKKSVIVATEMIFLGHHISRAGIRPDESKVKKVKDWPVPKSVTQVRAFLGLVRYMSAFLPNLAQYTAVLDPLTKDELKKNFPLWTAEHQKAFDGIKDLVLSADCLTVIDHNDMGENKVFVTTDASDTRSGAILSYGPTWESARPVAFDSMTFKAAELNYPVHDKEMLAIIRALKKWRSDLIGIPFTVYTDHRTLEYFQTQKDLSRRQMRWMELMSQYDCRIVYVKGQDNSVADALSRTDFAEDEPSHVLGNHIVEELQGDTSLVHVCVVHSRGDPMSSSKALAATRHEPSEPRAEKTLPKSTLKLLGLIDGSFVDCIKEGYVMDSWCKRLFETHASSEIAGLTNREGLWFLDERLLVPNLPKIRARIFQLAHDALGHFGFKKSYASLQRSFYWPHMRDHLEKVYLPSCSDCQRNKSATSKPHGPLHPLPTPDDAGQSIAMDFVGPCPEDDGFDFILTITDRLGADVRFIPCKTTDTAEDIADKFFEVWYLENGLPTTIVADRDARWTSAFWKRLHKLSGIKLALSSSFHPETDGASERTNRTLIQTLRYFVDRQQAGWVKALPRIRFALMNTLNHSTGLSGFQIRLGRSPRLIPALLPVPAEGDVDVHDFLEKHKLLILEAQDNLRTAKFNQTFAVNRSRKPDPCFKVGDKVMLSTTNRRKEYKAKGAKRAAKFFPRWDGPYPVKEAFPATSSYTLDLPESMNVFPTFHVSQLKKYHANDDMMFPTRAHLRPPPVSFADGSVEYVIDRILDARKIGRGYRYLVRWKGYGQEDDCWVSGAELKGTLALDEWLEKNSVT